MRVIFKYKLADLGKQVIPMPHGAKVLTVQIKDGTPHIWVLQDSGSKRPTESRRIFTLATGQLISDELVATSDYVGTYQDPADETVWHVFAERTIYKL